MIVLGIDPGVSGALAVVDTAGPRFLSALDMPILRFGTKTRMAVDARAVGDWIGEMPLREQPECVVIEHQQPFGQEGLSTAFILGVMFGGAVTSALPLGLPVHFSTPGQWKRKADLLGKPKDRVLAKARQMFGVAPELEHGRGKGCTKEQAIARADAALIAFYGLPERVIGKRAPAAGELPLGLGV